MEFDENTLSLTERKLEKVQNLIRKTKQAPQVDFFNRERTKELFIPVDGGEIRCFHHAPSSPEGVRPVVFLTGWGTIPDGFGDFFSAVNDRAECYYLETREKNSSRIQRSGADFSMDQQARDIQHAIDHLGLAGKDFALIGTCWGSTMIAHGLARGIIDAPTIVLFDPMYALWFPKWILNIIAPITPNWFWTAVRPIAKRIATFGMKERTQRRRLESFIDSATVWKWKRTALQARDENLYKLAGDIRQEVFVLNGVQDHIHDNTHYPRLARLMPKGRFFYMQVDESQREFLMGMTVVEFAKTRAEEGLPAVFRDFEKKIR